VDSWRVGVDLWREIVDSWRGGIFVDNGGVFMDRGGGFIGAHASFANRWVRMMVPLCADVSKYCSRLPQAHTPSLSYETYSDASTCNNLFSDHSTTVRYQVPG
jgi:hypothetical protein